MKIIRVEDKFGYGPFQRDFPMPDYLRYTNGDSYPTVYQDNIDDKKISYRNQRHAVQSFDLFLHWFTPALEALAKDNFGIAEYEISEEYVVAGAKQVLFDVTQATKLCWIPLNKLI